MTKDLPNAVRAVPRPLAPPDATARAPRRQPADPLEGFILHAAAQGRVIETR
jgi:hypothetical protein